MNPSSLWAPFNITDGHLSHGLIEKKKDINYSSLKFWTQKKVAVATVNIKPQCIESEWIEKTTSSSAYDCSDVVQGPQGHTTFTFL